MNKKSLIIIAVFSLALSAIALPSVNAQEDLSFSVNVPDKVAVGEQMSGSASITVPDIRGSHEADLSVTVYVDENQILSKTITIADGETTTVSISHTFEKSGSHTVKAEGSISIGPRSFSGSKTVSIEVPGPKKVSITGASFAIPETLKDDIPKYKAGLPEKVKDRLTVQIPDTGFVLANKDNVLLVLSTRSDKGIANVEGWVLSKSLDVKGISLNVMVADTVSFEKEGTPASVGEILSNPDKYRLDLVKVNATRRHLSILYDPDDGSGIEFPVTSGYLVENPETVKSFLRKGIEKGKEIIRENGKPSILKDVLQTERTRLPVFDFENDYWINSPAVTNGIVLPSGSQVIDILGKLTPALDRILQLDNGVPVLYDVKTDLDYENVSSVDQLKKNPEQFRGKVVGFTAKGFGGGISIQETWEEQPPCGSDLAQIPTPQGPVCIDILVDVRLEGLAAWNKVSVPPKRTDFFLTVGASSNHQDKPYKQITGRFRFIGRVRSTKEIDNSLPEGMVLVIYDKRRVGSINYEQLAESVKKKIENKISTVNWSLTEFSENRIPQVPSQPPNHLVSPERPVSVKHPRDLPNVITIAKNLKATIDTVRPDTPISFDVENARLQNLKLGLKETVKDVKINYEKVRKKPPELPEPPGFAHVYEKFNISVSPDKIKKLVDEFSIPENWLKRKGVDREDIKVLRFKDGKWIPIHNIEIPSENDLVRTMSVNQTGNIAIGIIRGIFAKAPAKLPDTVEMRENILLHISEAGPKAPLDIGIENSKIGGIRANFSKVVKNLKTVVEKLKKKPPTVPEPPGLVHAYINISVNKPEASVENASITFWVSKEWLATHDISKENVLLLRYHEGAWENLPSKLVGENGTHFKYKAETPGFSTFAITAKAKAGVKPVEFEVSNLSLSKKKVEKGETTTVSVKVTNTGGKKGTCTAKLSVDGKVKTRSVTLRPGESEKVTFQVSVEKAGTYQIKIGELSKTLNVVKPVPVKVQSRAFGKGQKIPTRYTADGKNISPPLTIKNVPNRAKSLALVVVDLDAPGGKFTHWIMWNIPTNLGSIPKNVPKEKIVDELGGAKQGKNDFGKIGYGGPSPPKGTSHRYRFTLYALDKKLELSAGATKGQLRNCMEGHILQKSELTGVYKRLKGGGLPLALIGGVIVVVIAISAFALYRRK